MVNKKNRELDRSLKLIIQSSFIVFIGIFLSKILTYAYKIIIARSFGAEIYGIFSIAIMIMGLFFAFSSLGLSEGLLRYISIYRGKKQINKVKYILRNSLKSLFFLGSISTIILFFSAKFISLQIFHEPRLIIFLQVFSFFIPFIIISSALMYTLRAFEKIQWYSFLHNILGNSIKLFILIILILFGFQTNAIIVSYVFGGFGVFLAAFFFCKYKIPGIFKKGKINKKTSTKIIKNLFSYSWPLMFFAVIMAVFSWMDSFAIGYFRNATEVGWYNAAVPLAILFSFVPNLFIQLFFPLINKAFAKKNFTIIKQLSKQIGKWIFIFNLPLILILLFFPGAIINVLFGQEYLIAINALRILSIGSFFYSLSIVSNNILSMIGKSKLILLNIIVAAIVNIGLNIILVPMYGLNGAAISTAISFIILGLLVFFQTKYYTQIVPFRGKIFRIILISIIPTLGLIYFKRFILINFFALIAIGILFMLVYVFLILVTGCLDREDLMILKSIKNKIIK